VFRQARGRCGRSGQPGTCQIISPTALLHKDEEQRSRYRAEELNELVDFQLKKDELFERVLLPYYSKLHARWKEEGLLAEKCFDLHIIRERFAFLVNDLEMKIIRCHILESTRWKVLGKGW